MKKFQLWTKINNDDYVLHHHFDSYLEAIQYVKTRLIPMCMVSSGQTSYKIVGLMNFAHGKINKAKYEMNSKDPE
ncbi:MAG: hypothetical protein KGO96_07045 [Elusimicrobia bacterium]|nr:hypothetical protein [Elusimicrobiota bacterium]